MFTACEDVHMLSRIDSHISNVRLPWEKQGPPLRSILPALFPPARHSSPFSSLLALLGVCVLRVGCIVPIGSFSCWRIDDNGDWKANCTL